MPAVPREEAFSAVQPHPLADDPGDPARGRFYLYCRQQGCWPQEILGADPVTNPAVFYPFCPERNVMADYPPTLLLHGDKDTDVPYGLSISMADALARAGVTHELITIPNGAHGFIRDTDNPVVIAAEARVRGFLQQHLGSC